MKEFDSHPIAGIDYPKTLQEFDEWFPTEQACFAYLHFVGLMVLFALYVMDVRRGI
jgi:hypothetical protein